MKKNEKIPHNPAVKILFRYSDKELKEMLKKEKKRKKILINVSIDNRSRDILMSELYKLAIGKYLCEKDIETTADRFLYNDHILRILAAALSKDKVIVVEAHHPGVDDYITSRDFALVLDRFTAITDLEADLNLSAEEQGFKTVVF